MITLTQDDWISLIMASLPGTLFIILSIPLLFDKIPPNAWYGFRTEKTLSSKETWYKANRFMARDFLVFGILHTILMVVFMFTDIIEINMEGPSVLLVFPLPMALGLIVIIIRGFRYLKKL